MHVLIRILTYLHKYFLYVGVPVITYISNSTISFESKEVKLVCEATNHFDTDVLRIQIVWYSPGGMQINPNESNTHNMSKINLTTHSKVHGQVESILQFNMAHHTDSGVYTCRAFNHHLFHVEAKTKLIVECETTICIHDYIRVAM